MSCYTWEQHGYHLLRGEWLLYLGSVLPVLQKVEGVVGIEERPQPLKAGWLQESSSHHFTGFHSHITLISLSYHSLSNQLTAQPKHGIGNSAQIKFRCTVSTHF